MPYKDPRRKKIWQKKRDAQVKELRASNTDPSRWILVEARRRDKQRGFKCDLTKTQIALLINGGCAYCGETELRMTLDRIDNAKGYSTDNIRPACIRCNYIRRHMPYEAWLSLVPSVRKARELGLFKNWTGRVR